MIHTYRKVAGPPQNFWQVGMWVRRGNETFWESVKDFNSESMAAAYVSYLNGGDGTELNMP